jgi:hypothetical protein
MSWPTRRRFLAWIAALSLGIAVGIVAVFALGVASHQLLTEKRLNAVVNDAMSRKVIPASEKYDAFTECGVLTMIVLRHPELLHDVLDTRFALDGGLHPCQYLTDRVLTGRTGPIVSYINYPFASRHLEAIVLSAFDFGTARHLYGVLSYGAVAALALAAWFAAPPAAGALAPVFAVLLLAFGLDRFGLHLAHAPGVFVGIGGLAVMIAVRERLRGIRARLAVFGFLGVLVAAFDILNGAIPTVLSLAIVVNHFFFVRDNPGDRPWRRTILQAAAIPVCFLVGYVALSVGRLLAIELLYGVNWEPYRKALSIRLSSQVAPGQSVGLADIAQNFWLWRGQLTFGYENAATVLCVAAAAALAVCVLAIPAIVRVRSERKTAFLTDMAALIIASSVIVGWYCALPNHSYVHPWLMGRLAALPMAYCFVAALMITVFLARRAPRYALSFRPARDRAARLWAAADTATTRASLKRETANPAPRLFPWLPYRILYFTVSRPLVFAYLAGLSLIYVVVYVHTPLSIPFSPHDDMLFIKLGGYLSEGKWLGPYDQFALMKGPGYPAFLAIANWLGISIAIAHALFHCVATAFFVAVCQRFIKSHVLSALHFALLLWSPILLTVILMRVFRDAIYTDQVLLFLALFMLLLFGAPDARRRITFGIASGLALGWLWLTREEGVWLLPGLAILVAGAFMRDFRVGRLRAFATGLAILAVTYGATQIAFSTANLIAYRKFISVDFKERNFQRALGAIHSVTSGETRHYVSATRATRDQIYRVSPSFASLSRYLDVPVDQGWAMISCSAVPTMCGEIGSGWFMWALRDAVQAVGHYASPRRASAFYGQVADEITAACARGDLKCNPQLVPEMPQVTWSDFAILPDLYIESLNYLLMLNPPLQLGSSFGGHETQFQSILRFLNYPLYAKRDGEGPRPNYYEISGWYVKSASEWFSASVKDAAGPVGELRVERRASPDLAVLFPGAIAQRFTLTTHCGDDCILRLDTPDGALEKRLGEFRERPVFSTPVGAGKFYVESVDVQLDPNSATSLAGKVALSIREFVLRSYKFALVPVLALGLAGFLASLLFLKKAVTNGCFVIALTFWTLVFVRLTVLVLITATSMPSLHGSYHGPACALLVSASVLSIAAFLQLAGYEAPRSAVKRT